LPPFQPPHHRFNLLINVFHSVLPAWIGSQLLFPLLTPKFADRSFSLIVKSDLVDKRFLSAVAVRAFAC